MSVESHYAQQMAAGASHGLVLPAADLIELLPLVARTTAGVGQLGTVIGCMERYKRLIVTCRITASGGVAGDTLDAYVDVSPDNVLWLNAVHFTQQAGGGAARVEFAILDPAAPGAVVINATADAAAGVVRPAAWGSYIRARYTIVDAGAHGQSHTFSMHALAQG